MAIEIANATDLAKIGVDPGYPLSGDYIQTANITGVTVNLPDAFEGTYDFRGYSVDFNITVTIDGGLFDGSNSSFGTIKRGSLSGKATTASPVGDVGSYGEALDGAVENCVSSVEITGGQVLYGISGGAGTYSQCLFVGTFVGGSEKWPITANSQNSTVVNCYWDSDTTGITTLLDPEPPNDPVTNKGTPLTTLQLRGDATLPTGFDPLIWTKDPTPLDDPYLYSYPRLLRNDEMAITKNAPTVVTTAHGARLVVNATTSDCQGNEELVAAPGAGYRIVIKRFSVSMATATTVVLNYTTTALIGPHTFTTTGIPWVEEYPDSALVALPENTALNMDAAASGVVTITLTYEIQRA